MKDIAAVIEHTLLRPDATEKDIEKLCSEAMEHRFHAVCLHPCFTETAREALSGSPVKIAAVVGFPLGASFPRVKIYEAMEALHYGADELDVVIHIGSAKSGNWKSVEQEISDIVRATPQGVHKIIIETCYLSDEEKKRACRAAVDGGAEFIKTSTGFGPSGALLEDVRLMTAAVRGKAAIKAAGGIKTLAQAEAFLAAGAARIGTSSGIEIVSQYLSAKEQKSNIKSQA